MLALGLALFAFRREIGKVVIHLSTKQLIDPKTGKIRISLTDTLKLLLFVEFMRRLQASNAALKEDPESSAKQLHALAVLGDTNPVLGVLLNKILAVPMFNPAYIPPVFQHYTFERINERYIKDGLALHKALHAKHDHEFK